MSDHDEIQEIRRRAGLLEQETRTFDMAAWEDLGTLIDDEAEFLTKLGNVLGRAMAPDRARDILRVLGNRRTQLLGMKREVQAKARQQQGEKGRTQGPQGARPQGRSRGYA